ncbi:hypothetical protein [Streptomyces beihaiensis]|uniref:Lipoprotein n=1 Tax=Streptomyces beihaiensis TaxID=2984495 RepID=A0ABT3U0G2_9ACTN|nr:hypothetical protein [Streptomyces beihaiensis]MCX3062796.1 hypothetical protein [Streptomyces beihaiensis]
MTAIRTAAATALLTATALSLAAPAAVAAHASSDPFRVSVTPTTIAAGGKVTLRAEGCGGSTTVSSGVFDTVTIARHHRTAVATVDRDARQGAIYSVRFTCSKGGSRTVDLTIAGGRPVNPTPPPPPVRHHGVRAGVGGSVGHFDLPQIGVGAALIAGTLGAAYRRARRRAGDAGT